ncbi:hypothetical protein AB0K67_03440 [Nonomuraea sp. NPDC052634]
MSLGGASLSDVSLGGASLSDVSLSTGQVHLPWSQARYSFV